jgi:3-phosphoshikimate 1-carboxyvinyltransferase
MGFLRALGVVVREGPGEVRIAGGGWVALAAPERDIDCGNSGTTMRLGAGVLAGRPFMARLTGDASLKRRPMRRIIEPLRSMGADIRSEGENGLPPLIVLGGPLRGIVYRMTVASAQVKSAVLLAGLQAAGDTTVEELEPTRDHTERLLPAFGVSVRVAGADGGHGGSRSITITGGRALVGASITLPGDFSSAAFFVVGALLVPGSEIVLRNVGINPTRTGLLEVLEQMGASIEIEPASGPDAPEPVGSIRVRSAALRGVAVDPRLVPRLIDELPILCVAAACAEGPTTITGAAELRLKESDRISVMVRALRAQGAEVEELPDGLVVRGRYRGGAGRALSLRGGAAASENDHRVAMAMAIAGLAAENGICIENSEAADVSFPGFYARLQSLLGG